MTAWTLFDAVRLGDLDLKNRLVAMSMTTDPATADGCATLPMTRYHARRASAGLIVTQAIEPGPGAHGRLNAPGLFSEAQVRSWRQVTDAVHLRGGMIIAQLMHAGRIAYPSLSGLDPPGVAPAGFTGLDQGDTFGGPLDFPMPFAMTLADIGETTAAFAHAAQCAISSGFDGVEIQGGHGFLIHQFMADNANRRTDRYGGSLTNRVRFTVEVVEAVVGAIGPRRTGLRISPGHPANGVFEADSGSLYSQLLRYLPALAYLHVTEHKNRRQSRELRLQWNGALILNPHETDADRPAGPDVIAPVLRARLADGISFGALFHADPDLADHLRRG